MVRNPAKVASNKRSRGCLNTRVSMLCRCNNVMLPRVIEIPSAAHQTSRSIMADEAIQAPGPRAQTTKTAC